MSMTAYIEELKTFILEEMAKFQIPAASIAIVNGHELIWQEGFGWQDKEKKIKASPSTVYRVGSISKLFTAIAIMQLHEKGIVNIDNPITCYCPELIFKNTFKDKNPITLRHLLAHRAGIIRESPVGNYFDDTEPSISETVNSIVGSKLIYQVGRKCKYSNLGPTVAGYILEKVTGMAFDIYMERFILKPLHMHSSSFLSKKSVIGKNLAKAYMINFEGKFFEAPRFQLGTLPAGNLYSTVADLAKFMICLINKGRYRNFELVKVDTLKEMFTPQFEGCQKSPEFGLGFAVGKFGKYTRFWHNGILYGFSSDFMGLSKAKIGVILLNNLDSAVGFNDKIKFRALHLLLDGLGDKRHPTPPKIIQNTDGTLSEFAGKYQAKEADAWVRVDNSHIFIKTMGITKRICPIAKDKFITDDRLSYGLEIQFYRNSKNKVISMKVGEITYKKIEGYSPVYLVPEKLKKFVGDYGKSHNILRIKVKDEHLCCQIEWFYEYPLTPVDSLVFAFPNYGLYDGEFIQFEQAENKEIIAAIAGFVRFQKIKGEIK